MLPSSHWTLLVNSVESLVPGGWEILSAFSMIPRARIDDLMVSYAADGGGVGAHVDNYDVFLVQGSGRRRWRIDASAHGFARAGRRPRSFARAHAFRSDTELKLLKDFSPTH